MSDFVPDEPAEIDDSISSKLWIFELVFNVAIQFLTPEQQEVFLNEDGEIDWLKIIEAILESDWYDYISEDTALLLGELVYDLTMKDY